MFVREVDGAPWYFYHGYYFRNSETTGTSVRGTLAVYTKQGICLAPFTKDSGVTHIGRDFNQRLSKMFQHIIGADVPVDEFTKGIDKLLTTSLGYVDLDEKARRAFARKAVSSLHQLGLSQGWAKEIFDATLKCGRVEPRDLKPYRDARRLFASRTFFDMLCPIVRMAVRLPSHRREGVEQVAYKVLTGKLSM
jgi:hypothetical protein